MRFLVGLILAGLLYPQGLPLGGIPVSSGASGTTVTYGGYLNGPTSPTFNTTPTAHAQIWLQTFSTSAAAPTAVTNDSTTSYTFSKIDVANGFAITVIKACDYLGGSITNLALNGTALYSSGIWATGGTAGGCTDGGGPIVKTGSSGASMTSNSITTTNAHSLLISAASNACGSASPFTVGTDGQGNTMVARATDGGGGSTTGAGVLMIQTFGESAANAYSPTATNPASSCAWKMVTDAIK